MATTPAAMTEPDGPEGFMVQLYIISAGATIARRRGQTCEVVRGVDPLRAGSGRAGFFELAFHAGQAEKEDPPEADGKERNYERNGEQLLERFHFAHESFRDEERLKRAERNHVQQKQSATLATQRARAWPTVFN